MNIEYILASASPRRKELLAVILPEFRAIPSSAQEILPSKLAPCDAVRYLAALKASQVASEHPESFVIGADTVVAIEGEILGKPQDKADCQRMLRKLSGRMHKVYTGVDLIWKGKEESFYVETQVEFFPLSEEEILSYSSSDEPYDKAGAYGIQGKGSLLIKGICGDYFNVMGLPVSVLARKLRKMLAEA